MFLSKSILLIILMIPIEFANGESSAVVIFSNRDLSNNMYVNRAVIQRIFTRKETRWINGDNIIVYIKHIDSIEHRAFVTNVLNMTIKRYREQLNTSVEINGASPVIELPNDAKMLSAIHSQPGSIGYIDYNLIINEKVIRICDDNLNCT